MAQVPTSPCGMQRFCVKPQRFCVKLEMWMVINEDERWHRYPLLLVGCRGFVSNPRGFVDVYDWWDH